MSNTELEHEEEETTKTDPSNLVDLIKQDFEDLAKHKEAWIPVKGYEKSGLAICYGMPEGGSKQIDNITTKVEREVKDNWTRGLLAGIDTMILLCRGIYVKPADVEEYVMLDPQETGVPVRFDDRMAEIVGLPSSTPARAIVKKVFDNNDFGIMDHCERLNRFLRNAKADLEQEVWQLGN